MSSAWKIAQGFCPFLPISHQLREEGGDEGLAHLAQAPTKDILQELEEWMGLRCAGGLAAGEEWSATPRQPQTEQTDMEL